MYVTSFRYRHIFLASPSSGSMYKKEQKEEKEKVQQW
jgi:hypothetical protein